MTTPVPSVPGNLLHRALVEALESVATREQSDILLRRALLVARLEGVPDEGAAFHQFVQGALQLTLQQALGTSSAELVCEQAWHVVRLVAPSLRRQATGTGDDADELSGERSVETPSARGSGVGTVRRRPEAASAGRAVSVPPPALPPLEAPILFPRARSNESGTQRRRDAITPVAPPPAPIARISSQPPRGGVEEVRGPRSDARAAILEILVVTLDPRLVRDVEGEVAGRCRVTPVLTLADLVTQLGRLSSTRIGVVLDTGVPSVDLPTFASIAGTLPAGAQVVLWGTDERQKLRAVAMFPRAAAWVASGAAASPIPLIFDP